MTSGKIRQFQDEVLTYYNTHKRKMAWRDISNPYKIFISEMMLQQTQVERVKIKYAEFIKKFPTLRSVAQASTPEVLKVWQGLGYNRRAFFIKKSCEEIISKYKGVFPKDFETLQTLPGIGPSTAGALCAFAYNQPVFFIETNVRAVILHFFFKNKEKVTDKEIMEVLKKVSPFCHPGFIPGSRNAKREIPGQVQDDVLIVSSRDWYYTLYDYGTFLKKSLGTKKKTSLHKQSKHYTKQSKFEGSFRQKRANVLKLKLTDPDISDTDIISKLNITEQDLEDVLDALTKDGLI
jgi:A/G-specific adenine glycosylase